MAEGAKLPVSYENAPAALPRITFVLPGRGSSGGIRVTVEMANRLLGRGHDIRVAYRTAPFLSVGRVVEEMKVLQWQLAGGANNDWLKRFSGPLVKYSNLENLSFEPHEIVIAVGTFTIHDVSNLAGDVQKLRFCHGFREDLPGLTHSAWGLPMPTITVSPMLSQRIRELSGEDPVAVVANAISRAEYFVEPRFRRDGVGAVFSRNYKKDPDTMLSLFQRMSNRWPELPLYMFGADPRPAGLPSRVEYILNPTQEKARELYNRSLVWLVSSRSEGFCLPILEAMACGCCVVSTDHDSAPGLVHDGVNGFLVPIADDEAFMEKIQLLLERQEQREVIVRNSQQTVDEFSWDTSVDQMETLLIQLNTRHLNECSKSFPRD